MGLALLASFHYLYSKLNTLERFGRMVMMMFFWLVFCALGSKICSPLFHPLD